jgi:hypothetical protein
MLAHKLYSQDQDLFIAYFDKFDKQEIKNTIIDFLKQNPNDVLEHCKEYSKTDIKKYYGSEIISFYGMNPKNGKVSKIITKGNKDYFKDIEV